MSAHEMHLEVVDGNVSWLLMCLHDPKDPAYFAVKSDDGQPLDPPIGECWTIGWWEAIVMDAADGFHEPLTFPMAVDCVWHECESLLIVPSEDKP